MLTADAEALLGCSRFGVVALGFTQKNVFKLVHPRIDEKEGGVVVGNDRRGGDEGVALLFKVVQKAASDLLRKHKKTFLKWKSVCPKKVGQVNFSPERAH